jgi:hypothetical protein
VSSRLQSNGNNHTYQNSSKATSHLRHFYFYLCTATRNKSDDEGVGKESADTWGVVTTSLPVYLLQRFAPFSLSAHLKKIRKAQSELPLVSWSRERCEVYYSQKENK